MLPSEPTRTFLAIEAIAVWDSAQQNWLYLRSNKCCHLSLQVEHWLIGSRHRMMPCLLKAFWFQILSTNSNGSWRLFMTTSCLIGSINLARQFASLCCSASTMERIDFSGTSSLCTFCKPYAQGNRDPRGIYYLSKHAGVKGTIFS